MPVITLAEDTDFAGWRRVARALVQNGVLPSEVTWQTGSNRQPRAERPRDAAPPHEAFNVPAKFVRMARAAILHRDPARFALLYRLLWRLRRDRDLLAATDDADVARAVAFADAVHRDINRMQTLLRFREIGREQKAHYVAWFEPGHHIVTAVAPFFANRFADMPWSILTPDLCAHWDGHEVSITPGIAEALVAERLEEVWRRYCIDNAGISALRCRSQDRRPGC
jgi:probable DNA metabolism protein